MTNGRPKSGTRNPNAFQRFQNTTKWGLVISTTQNFLKVLGVPYVYHKPFLLYGIPLLILIPLDDRAYMYCIIQSKVVRNISHRVYGVTLI